MRRFIDKVLAFFHWVTLGTLRRRLRDHLSFLIADLFGARFIGRIAQALGDAVGWAMRGRIFSAGLDGTPCSLESPQCSDADLASGQKSCGCINQNWSSFLKSPKSANLARVRPRLEECKAYLEEKLGFIQKKRLCSPEAENAVRNALALTYERLGDRKWAEIMLQSVLERDPGHKTAAANLERLRRRADKQTFQERFHAVMAWRRIAADAAAFCLIIGFCAGMFAFGPDLLTPPLNSDEIFDMPYWRTTGDIQESEIKLKPDAARERVNGALNASLEDERNLYVLRKHLDRLVQPRAQYILPPDLDEEYKKRAKKAEARFQVIEDYYNEWDNNREREVFGWTAHVIYRAQAMEFERYGKSGLKELLANLRHFYLMEREWSRIFGIDLETVSQPITIAESNVNEDVEGGLHKPDTGIRQINKKILLNFNKERMADSFLGLMCTPPDPKKGGNDSLFSPEFAYRTVYVDRTVSPPKAYHWKALIEALAADRQKWEPVILDLVSHPIHNFALGQFHLLVEKQHNFYSRYLDLLSKRNASDIRDPGKDHRYDALKVLYVGYMGGPRRIRSWYQTVYLSNFDPDRHQNETSGELYERGEFDIFVNRQLGRLVEAAKKVEFFHQPRAVFYRWAESPDEGTYREIEAIVDGERFKKEYPALYEKVAAKSPGEDYIVELGAAGTDGETHVAWLGQGFFSLTQETAERLGEIESPPKSL